MLHFFSEFVHLSERKTSSENLPPLGPANSRSPVPAPSIQRHTYPRGTQDIDLVVALDSRNTRSAITALSSFGYRHVSYEDAGHTLNDGYLMDGTLEVNRETREDAKKQIDDFLERLSSGVNPRPVRPNSQTHKRA